MVADKISMKKKSVSQPDAGAAVELRRQAEKRLRQKTEGKGRKTEGGGPSEADMQVTLHNLEVHQIELEIQNENLRATQGELAAERESYFNLYDLAPMGYCTLSEKGVILEANLTAATLLGVIRGNLIKFPFSKWIFKGDYGLYYLHLKHLMETGQPQACELRILKEDGTMLWGWVETAIMDTDSSGQKQILLCLHDITQRKRAEESQARLAIAVEQSAEAIVITDPQGTITYVNPAFEKITGYSRAEALGKNPRILKSGQHDGAFYQKMWQTLILNGVWSGHVVNKRKDGTLYEEETTISPVLDSKGQIVSYVAVKRDVTQEVAIQKSLLQAQKLEAVGRLAGGVAHDFNNLLMVVGGYASLLLKRLPEEHVGHEMMGEVRKAVERGAALTQQLLAFGGKQVTQIRRIGLNPVVEESSNMLKQLLPANIQVIRNCATDLVSVMGDSNQMGQVLMNLIINARDAMPKGGTLTLETENMDARSTVSLGFESVPEGKYARLTVRDDGAGMTREVQSHLFEPFYTTKEKGKGTGLGLSIVHGIVVRLGGHLVVQSQVGKGSAFHILLPEAQETPAVKPESSLPKPKMEANTETILLVEDEEMLRRVTTEILRSEGYRVIHAGEAKEALLALNDSSVKIHLMLSDVVMPGMQGTDLAEEALRLRPEIKVILMSGYSENRIMDQMISRNEVLFLSKPIPEEHLLRKLREVLGRM